MADTRQQILNATAALLESQGYHATGLNQIIAESGAPKGSLYHYFPDGKEQIAEEAILQVAGRTARRIDASLAMDADPAEAVRQFAGLLAQQVESSGFRAGGPLTTVAGETATHGPERLNLACRGAYRMMKAIFTKKMAASGMPAARADELAGFILSSFEGAILLSRTLHNTIPLRQAGACLAQLIQSYLSK
jgi:TetR/AcrR family transcriptional repressor of lmrAB and yxaGH operons